MAVDYKSLSMDTRLGRKYKTCARCNKEAAVTVRCPVRENKNCRNPYICVYCCWKCGYSKNTPQGRACSLMVNKKIREQGQTTKATKRKKKQNDYDADYSFLNN